MGVYLQPKPAFSPVIAGANAVCISDPLLYCYAVDSERRSNSGLTRLAGCLAVHEVHPRFVTKLMPGPIPRAHIGVLIGPLSRAMDFYHGILGFEEFWRGVRVSL